MPTSITYFSQVIVFFVLDLEQVCAESYVKFHFVTILSPVTLQGSVCIHFTHQVKWIVLMYTMVLAWYSALTAAATCQVRWKFANNF